MKHVIGIALMVAAGLVGGLSITADANAQLRWETFECLHNGDLYAVAIGDEDCPPPPHYSVPKHIAGEECIVFRVPLGP